MEKKLERIGYCLRCGRCCKGKPLLDSMSEEDREFFMKITGIFEADVDKLNCPYCEIKNGYAVCGQYPDRPEFCKAYPAMPGDLIEGCGFRFKIKEENETIE